MFKNKWERRYKKLYEDAKFWKDYAIKQKKFWKDHDMSNEEVRRMVLIYETEERNWNDVIKRMEYLEKEI
jgi:hypothetical protein